MFKLLDRPVFILKKELVRIPVYGWALLWMGMIRIDRSAGVSAIRAITKQIQLAFKQNRSLVVFPEGTRSKLGEALKIQPGIVAIHKALPTVPIIPIALDSAKLWPKGAWIKKPGIIKVQVGQPINIHPFNKEDFLQKIRMEINNLQSDSEKE